MSDPSQKADEGDEPLHASHLPGRAKTSSQKGTSLSGVVLAGGRSRRYGKNKALVTLEGVSLIERVCRVLKLVADPVILSTNDPELFQFLGLPTVRDIIPGLGPLSGIHAGLSVMPGEAALFVACDMPNLNAELIRFMAASRKDADAVVPRVAGLPEPLHAIYGKTCLGPVSRAIKNGEHRIVSFFPDIRIKYIEENQIRRFDPNLDVFANINRPEELQLAELRASLDPGDTPRE
ncbi:MAG: molybdenum cofactor guanylyltransferase [Desulfobacteraceae bacterium]|jgi:molybdopterin-guanine dinucleotide biosynthesis protein A